MSCIDAPRLAGLAPIHDAETEILLLGSFPGEASLRSQQYYGHPRNHFWKLVGGVIDAPLAAMAYADRIDCLRAHRIGVWDVISQCLRKGSLDSAITDATPNDFEALFAASPRIRLIGMNGGKAFAFRKVLETHGRTPVQLPSSSPANATQSLATKQARWRELLRGGQ